MIFRQLFDSKSSTYTYLLADEDTREAVLIDTVFEQVEREIALLRELDVELLATLETHVHADHITAASLLRSRLGSKIMVARASAAAGADRLLDPGDKIEFGKHHLEVRATPGHTDGCVTYVLDDQSMAFTGDALLIRGAGRTDFQQGNAGTLYKSVHEQIFSLPETTMLYPAHDYRGRTVTTVAEESGYNPRLGGERSQDDFVGYMDNLGLPHPKMMAEAVPANLQCGAPSEPVGKTPDWAPIVRTFAGIPEIPSRWLAEHLDQVRIIDVREDAEFTGELGHIEGAELVPLGTLREACADWSKDDHLVLVCRSGGRSAQGTVILEKAGFPYVANLDGGMIQWRADKQPIAS
jgi:glyoxylase-like metal-dependent hydrolase (beta-lactamase superfamily II)/rhodanese-related sulfurtransferase